MTRPGLSRFVLPLLGLGFVLVVWTALSQTIATDLPSPARTWSESRRYVLEPFFKDGEMNQGIGRLAFYSLVRVGKGYLLALLIGTPIGFMLGLSRKFYETFDPLIQFLRPISPLAWLVIVASEMLTGTPGVGGFLWQEYNSLVYSHIILSVLTIGAIGFGLDKLMGLVEARIKTA